MLALFGQNRSFNSILRSRQANHRRTRQPRPVAYRITTSFHDQDGLAQQPAHYLKKATAAKIAMMREEVELFESGGKLDFHYGDYKAFAFDSSKVETVFRDGDEIKLGDI